MNANTTPARAVRLRMGWVGHYRLEWRTEWWPVTDAKGQPVTRETRAEAERDAWAAKYKAEHPVIYGENMFTRSARSAAEALFKVA